jgi:signal transduction histidine kinase
MRPFDTYNIRIIENNPEIMKVIKQHTLLWNIALINNEYILYQITPHSIKISLITYFIEAHIKMSIIFLILMIVLWIVTYTLSLWIVKFSLTPLDKLVTYVKKLNLKNLNRPVPLSWPQDDEIYIIGKSLQEAINVINYQTTLLKNFVTYASHEMRTPLMVMNSIIDIHPNAESDQIFFLLKKKYKIWIRSRLSCSNWLSETKRR